METEKVVMMESAEAATYRTNISGWVSADGRFFGKDERGARYSGGTHRLCAKCETSVVDKHSLRCRGCQNLIDREKFDALPRAPWDGESPIYSERLDKYFFHGEVWDYLEDDDDQREPYTEDNLMLVHCDPVHLHQLDTDTWQDELSTEDDFMDLPDAVAAALDVLNAAIKASGPVSWMAGKTAVQLPLGLAKEVSNG